MANPFVAPGAEAQGLTRVAWSARGYDAFASDPQRSSLRASNASWRRARSCCCTKARSTGATSKRMAPVLERLQALGYRTVLPG
jgi:hypothetical protein